jgi:hypothetical protein
VAGSLVFFYGFGGNAAHVGLSFGNGTMVNASSPQVGTVISSTGGNTGFGVPPNGFDYGGWLPPGLSLAYNGTGRHERVIGPGGGGGNTYSVTVVCPPNANKAELGRVTVEAIREFEKRSGKSWRN